MVAPEHQGEVSFGHDAVDLLGHQAGDPGDLRQIAGPHIAHLELLHVLDGDIALVDHRVTELAQGDIDSGDPDGGRPHVHAASAGPEVHGDAKHVDDHAPSSRASWTASLTPTPTLAADAPRP